MIKKTLVILCDNYPSKENLYGDVFVHTRLKYYEPFFNIHVIGLVENNKEKQVFIYEGISVENFNNKQEYLNRIESIKPNVIGIHFVQGWLYEKFIKTTNIPIVIWVHGAEALGWYRRLYNITGFKQGLGSVKANITQLWQVRKIIQHSNRTKMVTFVFVSEWMRKITEFDTASKINNFRIIPNPIDADLFKYREKPAELRNRILLIRSFESRKYANDIAIDAIAILSEKSFFKELEFSIYGRGKFFDRLTNPLKKFVNVNVYNFFIENINIPKVHKDYGVFLCPTRQDAQGVSMCEAMSSGLVVISSDCTAIPEFVKDKESGFLTRSPQDVANVIEYIYYHPDEYNTISRTAFNSINVKAGHINVIRKEIEILNETAIDEFN